MRRVWVSCKNNQNYRNDKGILTHIKNNLSRNKLGELLVFRGVISPNDLKKAIEDAKAGEIEYKNSDTLVQAGIGKSSFDKEEIKKNIIFFVEKISKDKPSGIKGDFIKRLFISPTMGPGINIDLGSINNS